MSASSASLNINQTFVPEIGQKIEKVTSFLDHVVRFIAGQETVNKLSESGLSQEQKLQLHSINPEAKEAQTPLSTDNKPKGFRYHLANAFHNIANNNSSLMDTVNGVLSSIYIAGAGLGKPLSGLISKSRRVEQGLNLVRRFATGAKINSPSRMFAAFLGLPALFVKDVGESMYLLNGFQSAAGNFAEDCMEAAKDGDVMEKGVYRNFFDEPIALAKKLTNSLSELAKKPSLASDPKWIEQSQLLALGNIGGSAILAIGLAIGNKDLARLGRNLQSISVDATKTTSNNIERSASALGFGAEMGLDTLNDKLAAGDSTRLSAGVALSGQIARTLGNVYQDTKFDDSLPKIYTNPVGFLKKAIPSIIKYGNPVNLFTRTKKDLTDKFENILTGRSEPAQMASPEALAKAPELEMAKPVEAAQSETSWSSSYDYDSIYDYSSSAESVSSKVSQPQEQKQRVFTPEENEIIHAFQEQFSAEEEREEELLEPHSSSENPNVIPVLELGEPSSSAHEDTIPCLNDEGSQTHTSSTNTSEISSLETEKDTILQPREVKS